MIIKELISETIAPLNPSDSAAFALGIMDEFKVSHLPIVKNRIFQGLISDTDIYNFNNHYTCNRMAIYQLSDS